MASTSRKLSYSDETSGDSVADEKPHSPLPNDVNKWPLDIQIAVLKALLTHKPVGINASFRVAAILESIYSSANSSDVKSGLTQIQSSFSEYDITASDVWNFLNTNYDMASVNQMEQNRDGAETNVGRNYADFSLPETEFEALMKTKIEQSSRSLPAPDSSKQRRKGKVGGRPTAVSEDTESLSSSRSSTPASGGGQVVSTNAAMTVPAPRRGRARKE